MFNKKTIILNSVNESSCKAVVNLERNDSQITGTVKLYNFKQELSGVLTLGILSEKTVFKAGLKESGFMTYTFKSYIEPKLKDFAVALVQSNEGEIKPLLFGASGGAGSSSAELRLSECLGVLQKKSAREVEKTLNENQIELEEDIEKIVDEALVESCGDCPYKTAFFEERNEVSIKNEENIKEESKEKISFFKEVSNQLDSLFEKYEAAQDLEKIIPNSKFVKVDYNETGDFYVVGLIFEFGEVKYICYGVPGVYSPVCPKELEGLAVWLPIKEGEPEGSGYWISYQDAENGENVKIEIV